MSEFDGITVVCYDITSDAVRGRLASQLEEIGTRVQYSIFEVRGQMIALNKICVKSSLLLRSGDSIRLYPLAKAAFQRVKIFGDGPKVEDQDFYML